MAFLAFFGLREAEVARVCRAVLPKFLLEAAAMEGLEAVRAAEARRETTKKTMVVAVCSELPTVMVEAFVREYLCVNVDKVVGWEVRAIRGRYIGLVRDHGMKITEGNRPVTVGLLIGEQSRTMYHSFSHSCQMQPQRWYTNTVTDSEKATWRPLPREKYPKPLVFHDGRLAFLPTPSAAIAMYTFLPLGFVLAVVRAAAFMILPYSLSLPLTALTGMRSRLVLVDPALTSGGAVTKSVAGAGAGRLFACNHRTLLDPIAVSCALDRLVTAVTYGLSRFSEVVSAIQTARLTRDSAEDHRRMAALLAAGDAVVVCPDAPPPAASRSCSGDPVALDTRVDVFYGTSTKPSAKWLYAVCFLMNMRPEYRVEFLEPMRAVPTVGNGRCIAIANAVRRMIREALGYELTGLTRKDKYKMRPRTDRSRRTKDKASSLGSK
ncbi:hypothetical protein EJB05_02705 [Eragrostis curvula]|uniref:Glycerol-3-phosphate acyltransferase RAM2/GPAT1-8 HAD-like domain-containing protein n=1 Tax=Eragrostis curvula TaxID=38414 RepID=A0A5J9WW71_9POAL|nr:hypothetical protein EJB05_02705 [Eragrostis curvula]